MNGLKLIAIFKLARSFIACGLGCVFLYLSFQTGMPNTNNPIIISTGTEELLIRYVLRFINLEPKEAFFQISLVFFILSATRLIEAIGLWFDKNWASYLAIASGLIYATLATYSLNQKFSWITALVLILSLLVSAYLTVRLIKGKEGLK